ncbi:MAG: hypothetical protein LBQ54_16000 [Planctomycetaceae bacterium]|jgi:hypothetical protein|nr:hypothetical protein [Planctomycetaceae bacterium]
MKKVCGNCKFANPHRWDDVLVWCGKEFKKEPRRKKDWYLIVDFCKDFEPRTKEEDNKNNETNVYSLPPEA